MSSMASASGSKSSMENPAAPASARSATVSAITAGVVRVAALAVDVQRKARRLGQAPDVCDQLVPRDLLVVLSQGPGESRARRGKRLEAR